MTDAECNAKIREAAETVKDALWRNRDEGLWVERLWDELDAALAVVPSPPTLAQEDDGRWETTASYVERLKGALRSALHYISEGEWPDGYTFGECEMDLNLALPPTLAAAVPKCRVCADHGWIVGSVGGDPDVMPEPCPACDEEPPTLAERIAAPGFDAEVDRAREILDARDQGWNEGVEAAVKGAESFYDPDRKIEDSGEMLIAHIVRHIRSLLIPTVPPTKEGT